MARRFRHDPRSRRRQRRWKRNAMCGTRAGTVRGVSPTLTGDHENRVTDYTAICVGNGQLHQTDMDDKTGALNCMHDQQTVLHAAKKPPRKYIVRRLIPLECDRLQGFPDDWGIPDYKESMTDEEVLFWSGVRCIHADAMGKKIKTFKSREALISWYNGLHTDSAEYKMWGNGIAKPCAAFVLEGIAEELCAAYGLQPMNRATIDEIMGRTMRLRIKDVG